MRSLVELGVVIVARILMGFNRHPILNISILWLLVLVTALLIVKKSHVVRELVDDHQFLIEEYSQLQLEWESLMLIQGELGALSEIENIATNTLKLQPPTAERLVVIEGGL